MVNINKLKGKIIEKGMNVNDVANEIGIDKATFYRRLEANGDTFTIREVDAIVKILTLTIDETNSIFLPNLSHNKRQIKSG